jgi:hypothetical protein
MGYPLAAVAGAAMPISEERMDRIKVFLKTGIPLTPERLGHLCNFMLCVEDTLPLDGREIIAHLTFAPPLPEPPEST